MNKEVEVVAADQPDEKKRALMVTQTQIAHRGPIPEAGQFAKYEETLPGAGDRILKMAENQSSHRQFIEKWSIVGDQIRSLAGLISALIVALSGIGGTIYLLLQDKVLGGSILGLGTLGSMVTAFIYGSQKKAEGLEKAEKDLDETK
jgi:uncharacterized membrane protein